MSAAIQAATPDLRSELLNWRERLEANAKDSVDTFQLNGLLREVLTDVGEFSLARPRSDDLNLDGH